MYKDSCCLSIVVAGNVAKDEAGVVKIAYDSEYAIRLKNKYASPVAVDLYVDSILINEVGHLLLVGNSSLDVDRWIFKDGKFRKFLFAKLTDKRVVEPNESENGRIEARFYKPKETVNAIPNTIIIHEHFPYYPIYPVIIGEHPVPYYPYPVQPWYWWYNGNMTYCNSNVTTNELNVNNVLGSSEIRFDSNFVSNGATVKGRETEGIDFSKADFSLEAEPTILSLKLIGYKNGKSKLAYCKDCGYRKREKENFCPKCGSKF